MTTVNVKCELCGVDTTLTYRIDGKQVRIESSIHRTKWNVECSISYQQAAREIASKEFSNDETVL